MSSPVFLVTRGTRWRVDDSGHHPYSGWEWTRSSSFQVREGTVAAGELSAPECNREAEEGGRAERRGRARRS